VRRGQKCSRTAVGEFALAAPVVLVTSGGIGGNHELVRANWPERLGTPPEQMISGVPDHVDGRMLVIAHAAGGRPRRCSPASTPSARSPTSCTAAMTTRGSC
jgi:predicted oxidoreductase